MRTRRAGDPDQAGTKRQESGQRSLRRVDFWYDTKGFLKGKADVTLFGMK